MTIRFFATIWGAILMTLVLFTALVVFAGLEPPESAQLEGQRKMLASQVSWIATQDPQMVMPWWDQVSGAHLPFSLSASECSVPLAIHAADGTCYALTHSGPKQQPIDALRPMLIPLLIGALVSAPAAILLAGHLTRPLRIVNTALRRLALGKLGTRIGEDLQGAGPSLSDLGVSFDLAANRLQTLAEGRQRLFHDISHEIRSPLARLRAALELISVAPARQEQMQAQMEKDIDRLDSHIEEILVLARSEAEPDTGQHQPLNLSDLIEPILSDAELEGRQKAITISYDAPENLPVSGEANLLHRAIENVIRNALKFAPAGSTIRVVGKDLSDKIELCVADEGPGVDKGDLQRIFDPFVRVGTNNRLHGGGLGLTITARAVSAHGGTISAERGTPSGLVIRLYLPKRSGQ